jgi:ribosomal protein S18 acetylase RimI-like enzyme
MIWYTEDLNGITAEKLKGFFVGWPNPPSSETHLTLLGHSDEIVLAIDDESGRVVGFITAHTDKVLTAYIPLLEVLPAYQGQGIGSELMRRLLAKLDHLYAIDLMCDPEVQPFYERLGMRPAAGMMIRHYDKQSGAAPA